MPARGTIRESSARFALREVLVSLLKSLGIRRCRAKILALPDDALSLPPLEGVHAVP